MRSSLPPPPGTSNSREGLKPFKAQIKTNTDGNITLTLPEYTWFGKRIQYIEFRINNVDYLNSAKNKKTINLNAKKGDVFNIYIKSQSILTDYSIIKSLSRNALLYSILFYFILFLIVIPNLTKKKLKKFAIENKIPIILAVGFFIVYFLLNCHTVLNINLIKRDWVLIGDSNFLIFSVIYAIPKRFHPYAITPLYPIYDILSLFIKNYALNLLIIYTFITSLTIFFFHKTISKINNIIPLNIIITLILGFSYCFIIFSYSFDVYVITALYLTIILYLLIKEIQSDKTTFSNIILISFFAALSFGVTITNIITILIIIGGLLTAKRNFKQLGIFTVGFLIFTTILLNFKSFTDHKEAFNSVFYPNTKNEFNMYTMFNLKDNSKYFYKEGIITPISPSTSNFAIIFCIFSIILILNAIRKFPDNKINNDYIMFNTLLISLLYNFITNFYWFPQAAFLFSHNYIVIWYVIFAYGLKFADMTSSRNKKLLYIFLALFLVCLIYKNCSINKKFQTERLIQHPIINSNMENMKIW